MNEQSDVLWKHEDNEVLDGIVVAAVRVEVVTAAVVAVITAVLVVVVLKKSEMAYLETETWGTIQREKRKKKKQEERRKES